MLILLINIVNINKKVLIEKYLKNKNYVLY